MQYNTITVQQCVSYYKTIEFCDIEKQNCMAEYMSTSFTVPHVQSRERTALMWASEGGYLDVVKELLKAQAVVDMEDKVCHLC